MPYDDSDVKKMIKYQTERQVGFPKSKKISDEVKELIHGILEAKVDHRFKMRDIKDSAWLQAAMKKVKGNGTHSRSGTARFFPITTPEPTDIRAATAQGYEMPTATIGGERGRSRAGSRHRD